MKTQLNYPDFESYKEIINKINESKILIQDKDFLDSSILNKFGIRKPDGFIVQFGAQCMAVIVFVILAAILYYTLPAIEFFLRKNGYITLKESKKVYDYGAYVILFIAPFLAYPPSKKAMDKVFVMHQHRRYLKSVIVHRQLRDDLIIAANMTITDIQNYISLYSKLPGEINIELLLKQISILRNHVYDLTFDKKVDNDDYREDYFEYLKKDKDLFSITQWLE